MKPKTLELRHPLHGVWAVAEQSGYWIQNGRAVGLQLQFCDGHTACMTFAEIAEARSDAAPQEAEICT